MRGIDIRKSHNVRAREAYTCLRPVELARINALQAWANCRTIPRNLTGRLPNRPLSVLDLCSGVGDSTAVLARVLPPGSRVLGLEYCDAFVAAARGRLYFDGHGRRVDVRFRRQNVLAEFRDDLGNRIPDASIDLINSSGAIGCHFNRSATAELACECARVVRVGGLALIDSGPRGTPSSDVKSVLTRAGFKYVGEARSCALDPLIQLCFRRMAGSDSVGLSSAAGKVRDFLSTGETG